MLIIVLIGAAGILYFLEQKIYKKFWTRGLSLKLHFEENALYEGEHGHLLETIENRSFLPLPFLHAKFKIGVGLDFSENENVSTSDKNYKNDLFSVLFYQRITRRLPFLCKHRGYYVIDSADLISQDLLLSNRIVSLSKQNSDFYVYPQKISLDSLEEPLRKLSGEMATRTYLYPDPFAFRGIRDYTILDPFHTINWKASARTGNLMVNEFDSTVTKRVTIFLNTEDETVIHHGRLHEESIRIAAAMAHELLSLGYPVRLILNGLSVDKREAFAPIDALGPAQNETILRCLSKIDLSLEPAEFYPNITQEMMEPTFNQSGFILISSCMKKPLVDAFLRLSDEAAAFFVAPLYDDMKDQADALPGGSYYRWRVEGHA